MSTDVFILDSTLKDLNEPRISRATALADFWDAGMADEIMTRRSGTTFEATTVGSLLQTLIDFYTVNDPDIAKALDRPALELFIRDMTANNYNIAFTDELPYGKRQAAPTLGAGAFVPDVGQVTITATFAPAQDVDRLYVKFTRNTGQEAERFPNVTLDNGLAIATTNLPSGVYTCLVAAIDSNKLRGFSTLSPTFTVL